MPIYDKSGNQLSDAYDKIGNSQQNAYDLNGNIVFQQGGFDYDDYTVSSELFRLSGSNFQSFAVYDNVIAQFQSDDKVTLVSLADGSTVVPQMYCKSYHGQSAFFMNEYYQQGDEFPLICVMGSYVNSWIIRITRKGTTLIKTLYIPTTVENGGYKLGNAYNPTNGHMYTLGYTNQNYQTDDGGTNKLILAEWDVSDLTDNGDDTYTPRLIGTKQHDFIVCIQGSCFYDGMIWATSGIGGSASHVYAFDPATFEILHTITLSNVEVEGCAWIGNDYLLVGQNPNDIQYRKVTFASL